MNRWDVALMRPIDDAGVAVLEEFADVTWLDEYADWDAFVDDVDRFEAIVHRQVDVTRDVIERATSLRVISKHGVGLDQIDVDAASERGVVVANTPGANARAVAEHAISLFLAVRKGLLRADRDLRDGEWDRGRYQADEIESNVLGMFGCGNIGRLVAGLAQGLGLSVLTYDPYLDAEDVPDGVEKADSKAELFERSDVVSLHAPLTEETRHAVSTAELEALGKSGILINTARGGIVDEEALVDALESGTIFGAGIDAYSSEPPEPTNPLFEFDTVVATPHIAGTTVQSAQAKARGAAENIRAVYEGRIPETAVNADRL